MFFSPPPQETERRCKNGGKCIPEAYWCDSDVDCTDASDEENCPMVHKACQLPNWSCDNATLCLNIEKVCDLHADCKDGSDEGLLCSQNLCSSVNDNVCSHFCHNSPLGHVCHCPSGMHLNSSKDCVEDHPCSQWGTCSQLCKSVSASGKRHKCYCQEDYYLETDGFTCKSKDKSPAYAIYSSRNELRLVNVRNGLNRPLLANLKNTVALDFYYTRHKTFIYWTDVVDDKIYRGTLLEDMAIIEIEAIIENGLGTAEGLAIDWIAGNIYWVESKLDQIEVAKLDGRYR